MNGWLFVGGKAINLANVASVELEARPANRGEPPAVVVTYAVSLIGKDAEKEFRQTLATERFVGSDAEAIREFFAAMDESEA